MRGDSGGDKGEYWGLLSQYWSESLLKIPRFRVHHWSFHTLENKGTQKETVEKHLGKESGIRGYTWGVLLAGTTVGGLYVAFPVAYSLYNKGAKLSVIFTYLGASAICRVPMTIFETSFMGIKFSIIRWSVSLPLAHDVSHPG